MKIKVLFPVVLFLVLAAYHVHAQVAEPPVPSPLADEKYILDELGWWQ